jgi:hypothetical protein
MAFGWRLICKITGRLAVVIAVALAAPGCQFNTAVPMNNNPPHWSVDQAIHKTLRYPDSTLCTLNVEDLNDTFLSIRACFTGEITDTGCTNPGPWPYSFKRSREELGARTIVFMHDPCLLGFYCGHIRFEDHEGAGMKVPFSYSAMLSDPLDTFPVSEVFWTPEPISDSTFIVFDFMNNKVKFAFPETGDSTGADPASTGLRSKFSISGDLETSVLFQLRDDMKEGFEVAFRISTSPSAGPWEGDKTGFLITGLPNHVRFTCSSINLQTDSRDVSRNLSDFAGYLKIARKADSVSYQFIPGDPQLPIIPMNKFWFPADTGVYVHMRMSVTDRLRARHCLWSDFRVTQGNLRF